MAKVVEGTMFYDDGSTVPMDIETVSVVPVESESLVLPTEGELEAMVEALSDDSVCPCIADDLVVVCYRCGKSYRSPAGEVPPERCACSVKFDYAHELPDTLIEVTEPTILNIRKIAGK